MKDSVVSVLTAGTSSGSATLNSMRALPAPSSFAASKIVRWDLAQAGGVDQHWQAHPVPGIDGDQHPQRGGAVAEHGQAALVQTGRVEGPFDDAAGRQQQPPQSTDDDRAQHGREEEHRLQEGSALVAQEKQPGKQQAEAVLEQHDAAEPGGVVPEARRKAARCSGRRTVGRNSTGRQSRGCASRASRRGCPTATSPGDRARTARRSPAPAG